MSSSQLASYLSKLFLPEEKLAASRQLSEAAAVSLVEAAGRRPQWVSVNPIKVWRTSANVTAYRNLLIERDDGADAGEQLAYMADSKFPVTTAVWSGNKSMHFVCALTEDIGYADFVEVRRRLDIIFPSADRKMKDPARLTRAPLGTNEKTGAEQELVVMDRKVTPTRLASWLARYDDRIASFDAKAAELRKADEARKASGELSESSWRFLRGEEGCRPGVSRHDRLYAIVCDLCDVVGLGYEEALALADNCAELQGITADASRLDEAARIVYDVYFKRKMRGAR